MINSTSFQQNVIPAKDFVQKTIFLFLFLVCFFLETAVASDDQLINNNIPVYGYEIVATYPHDPKIFTQGLCYVDGLLYEGAGIYGQSSLTRKTLAGNKLEIRRLPSNFFGEGVTVFGNWIVQLTWKAGTGFVWDKKTLQVARFFSYPTEGWGITHDGLWLIMSDGSAALYFLDPTSFQIKRSLLVRDGNGPVLKLNELEYIKGEIWANIWKDSRIVRIDPETGKVTGWIDLSSLVARVAPPPVDDNVLNGIAYDAENDRIFVTGKRWDRIYEIRVIKL